MIFLLEAAMFSLLFDPSDLLVQGQRIFDTYLNPKSEGRIVVSAAKVRRRRPYRPPAEPRQRNVACPWSLFARRGLRAHASCGAHASAPRCARARRVAQLGDVEALLKAAAEAGAKGPPAAATGLSPQLFGALVDEVTQTLSMDVWPRYKEAVLQGKPTDGLGLNDIDASNYVDMSKPSKKAVVAAMRNPVTLEHLRKAAEAQGVRESIDFCQACMSYKLLFSDDDRRPRATLIHDTYLKAGCDTPVNLPHTMIQNVEKNLDKCDPELFEVCAPDRSASASHPRPSPRTRAAAVVSPSVERARLSPFALAGVPAGGAAGHLGQHLLVVSQGDQGQGGR